MSKTEEVKQTSMFPTVHNDLLKKKLLNILVYLIIELSFLVCFNPHFPLPVGLCVEIVLLIHLLSTQFSLLENISFFATDVIETSTRDGNNAIEHLFHC